MKKIRIYIPLLAALFVLLFAACSKEDTQNGTNDGTELRIGVSFGVPTRLAELGSANDMAVEMNGNGLKNVGLYIYYTSDYVQGDLSKPYVRNLQCTVENGELLVVLDEGANPVDKRIYIYDEMTLVAFYPYNAAVQDFTTKADEELYPITRDNYADQYYIPYRAQTTSNPTTAFYTQLTFYPKHTYKIEVTVVSEDDGVLPTSGIQLLPGNDPVGNTESGDGIRAAWIDAVSEYPNTGGGSNVNQYVGYIWTKEGNKNDIKRGDVLIRTEDGDFMLIASQDVYVQEQNIYRYGYNMSTGEIFIPTSSALVHDMASLAALNGNTGDVYQPCDIDLSANSNWTPVNIYGGRYDGGGHAITGMTITSTAGNAVPNVAGLFGQVQGNATIANVDLVSPQITVSNPDPTTPYYVGALAGRLNTPISDEARQALISGIPDDLSPIVKEALIEDLLADMGNSTANIVASQVTEPVITVDGTFPYVGSIVGQSGDKDDDGEYKARIWDTSAVDASVTVNASNPDNNTGGYIGGFIGLNNGSVDRSFVTLTTLVPATNASPVASTGFTTAGTLYDASDMYINDSYPAAKDAPVAADQSEVGNFRLQDILEQNGTNYVVNPAHIIQNVQVRHKRSMLDIILREVDYSQIASVEIVADNVTYQPHKIENTGSFTNTEFLLILPVGVKNPQIRVTTLEGARYVETLEITTATNVCFCVNLLGLELQLGNVTVSDWTYGRALSGNYSVVTSYPTFKGPANTSATVTYRNGITQTLTFNSRGEATTKPAGRTIMQVNSTVLNPPIVLRSMMIDLTPYL